MMLYNLFLINRMHNISLCALVQIIEHCSIDIDKVRGKFNLIR